MYLSRKVWIQRAYSILADRMSMTAEQRRLLIPGDRQENAWQNLVRFASRRLVDQGLMQRGPRGYWSITQRGDEVARVREGAYQSYNINLENVGL